VRHCRGGGGGYCGGMLPPLWQPLRPCAHTTLCMCTVSGTLCVQGHGALCLCSRHWAAQGHGLDAAVVAAPGLVRWSRGVTIMPITRRHHHAYCAASPSCLLRGACVSCSIAVSQDCPLGQGGP
jgi:hypothetical protein